MIVTILLSRIADTQFYVRITVNDLWGAIALGFIANYAGYRFLLKLVPPEPPDGDPAAGVVVPQPQPLG